jgi:hypothetical protein
MCDVIYVFSMNKTVSVESESEPTQDLELVFHQSRISNDDEEIQIEPVELVATCHQPTSKLVGLSVDSRSIRSTGC